MNIAIIDDISTDAEALKNIAVSYFEKKQIRAEICHFFSAEEFFEDPVPGYLYGRNDRYGSCAQDPKTVR